MDRVLSYDQIAGICDVYMFLDIRTGNQLVIGMRGMAIQTIRIPIKRFSKIVVSDIASRLNRGNTKDVIILGVCHYAYMFIDPLIEALRERCRFIIISCTTDYAMDPDRLLPFAGSIEAVFSTQLRDEHIFNGFHFMPIGLLDHTPTWFEMKKTPYTEDETCVYVGFSTPANNLEYARERTRIQDALAANGFPAQPARSHSDMMHAMSRCQFCACPKGNGIDTHRLWEALAAGCAVVATDWLLLRCEFRGRIPAAWVKEFANNERVCSMLDGDSTEIMDRIRIDMYGDVFLDRWGDATRERMRRVHRFVGWKRSSEICRHILHPSLWISKMLRRV
jgi:hypothetical protein